MRLWHYRMLPYLPDAQLRGQMREAIAIMRQWRDKGKTNHLLINRVMEYPKSDLSTYYLVYFATAYRTRFKKEPAAMEEFEDFAPVKQPTSWIFNGWHDDWYMAICLMNLMEKARYGRGNSQLTAREWDDLLGGVKAQFFWTPTQFPDAAPGKDMTVRIEK